MNKVNNTSIKYVVPYKLPLDLECELDIRSGKGIRITSVDSYDKKNEKIHNGLQSDFFGTDFGDDAAFKERYSCKCGKLIGKSKNGDLCEKCGSIVEYNDIDLTKFGWIILDKYPIMSAIYYSKLCDAIGKIDGEYILPKILKTDYKEDSDEPEFTDKELLLLKKCPYLKKGMLWFYENFDEVIEFYEKRKSGKAALFNEIKNEKDLIWTHSIPVYSSILRTEMPNGEKGSKVYTLKINTCYKSMIGLANKINELTKLEDIDHYYVINNIDNKLYAIQKEWDTIFEETVSDLTSKSGIINGKILGGRYNFSARNIIIPDSGILRSNEIRIGYLPFLELYRYELINLYSKIHNCNISKASNTWKKATNRFDQNMYDIIQLLLTDKEYKDLLWVIEGRHPFINYGSTNALKIVGVGRDFSDKSLAISDQILTPQNADFDGDIVSLYRIIGYNFTKVFRKNMDPRYNLMISRMTGKANPEMLPNKEEITAFWLFNNI